MNSKKLIIIFSLCISAKLCTANGYYDFNVNHKIYDAAVEICGEQGRYLTSIKSSQNQQIIDACQVK